MEGGRDYEAEELLSVIRKAKPYFGKKGGVTFSGGEPLLQAKALIPLFKILQEEGVHIALDTNGRILNHFSEALLDCTDLVMLDIKAMTEEDYQLITTMKNVETTFRFADYRERSKRPMWLRYVLIPGLTDKEETLRALGSRYQAYQSIQRVEIQPYHKLGVHKWEALGWDYPLKDARANTPEELQRAKALLEEYFGEVRVN